jgi:hypothetical protein
MNTVAALEEAIVNPDLRHINFFNGRLLTGGDLEAEQSAHHAHGRLLGSAVGAGVAAGLRVSLGTGSSATAPILRVSKGVAVNRSGQTLRLECDQDLSISRQSDPLKADACVFDDCGPRLAASTLPSGSGYYLLLIAPASVSEGKAPVSGLGNATAVCNARFLAEGVKFRLVPLNVKPPANSALRRNSVAYQCFGLPGAGPGHFFPSPSNQPVALTEGFESLVQAGRLTPSDVPLALIEWTSGGLGFIDRWAVRRRIVRPESAWEWSWFPSDFRLAQAEAMLHQFEDEAFALLAEPGAPARRAHERFVFLPPAAFLAVGATRFDWKRFLGVHSPSAEIPIDEGLARAVIRHSLAQEPVPVMSPGGTGAIAFHVYRVAGRQDYVLFARSSLNEVVAADVAFDNTACQLPGATTVQKAIDALCRDRQPCCSITVVPGVGWERPLVALRAGEHAHVCFQPGEYRLERALELKGKGHLVFTGAGPGTRIVATGTEAACVFNACRSVSLSRLGFEGGAAKTSREATHVNGAITFLDCPAVELESVGVRCQAAPAPRSACIVVRNAFENAALRTRSTARIRHCDLEVGHAQIGILVVNVARPLIEDNVLRAGAAAEPRRLLMNLQARAQLRKHLFSKVTHTARRGAQPGEVQVTFGGHTVSFRTAAPLTADVWTAALNAAQPTNIKSSQHLAAALKKVADRFLVHGGKVPGMTPSLFGAVFGPAILRLPAAGAQGIVIAGQVAADVRLLHNTITDFRQGIHVGVSHRDPNRTTPDRAGSVLIESNTIHILLLAGASRQRHGIFVGNCESLVVEDNYVTLGRAAVAARLPTEGLRIFGFMGARVIVRANHLAPASGAAAFNVGVHFRALNPPAQRERRLWIIGDNHFASSPKRFEIPAALQSFVRGLDTNSA